jgi:quinol monooxygenase YgiN
MVKITATLSARPGRAKDMEALVSGMVAASRAEPGASAGTSGATSRIRTRFVLDELYVDDAAIAAHCETPAFR